MSRRWIILGAAIFFNVVLLTALIMRARPTYPLPRGTSKEFWDVSTKTGVGCIEGDFAYYSPMMLDSTCVYWVPKSQVMRDFPAVLSKLENKAAAAGDASAGGYQRWKKLPLAEQDVNALLLCLQDERIERRLAQSSASPGSASLLPDMDAWMLAQIEKADHYWANFAFELLYLGGLIWFVFWPFIRQQSITRRVIHLALSPCLLLLPAWLGYCGVLLRPLGPTGGIVYPVITFAFGRFPSIQPDWNFAFQQAIPHPLDVLNQSPAWSFAGAPPGVLAAPVGVDLVPGYLDALLYGVLLAIVYLTICYLAYLYRCSKIHRPGFEVIPQLIPSSTAAESAPPDPARSTAKSSAPPR